jgi:hypothetical protein
MHHMKMISTEMQNCITLCNECRDECETVLYQHCLPEGGKHAEQEHVRLMADCIEACQAAAHFMLRGSDNHVLICDACAEICEACAESCEGIGGEHMEDCADTCRQCAESCRAMSRGGSKQGRSAKQPQEQRGVM